jgi:hypothetical protein
LTIYSKKVKVRCLSSSTKPSLVIDTLPDCMVNQFFYSILINFKDGLVGLIAFCLSCNQINSSHRLSVNRVWELSTFYFNGTLDSNQHLSVFKNR